jgi:uncharacterized protein (TIGR03437 family)
MIRARLYGVFACLILCSLSCPAQLLVNVGYESPQTLRIAPGQVTTFFLSGVSTILPPENASLRATQVPLPLSLAGFSATVSQVLPSGAVVTKPLPFLAVSQVNNCSGTSPSKECVITELTVQIPVDLWVDWGSSGALGATTTVAVASAGTVSRSFNVALLPQNFHIVTTCDTGLPNPVQAFFPVACSYAVTHPSGELVTQLNPAKPGEELVMYAFGLGGTKPAVPAGSPAPNPAALAVGNFSVAFAYTGAPALAPQTGSVLVPNPTFVGLAPGQVGLYQVNFTLPPPNGPISGCDHAGDANLRIVLSSDQSPSFDTARICVAVGN